MVSGSEFKKRLRSGKLLLGTMLALFRNPKWVSSISNLNFDFVVIDSEHAPRDRGEISDLVSAFRNTNTVPIVRVPGVSSHHVTQAIDLGAAGVIIPYCETVEQVKSVVGAAKWNPLKGIALEKVMDNNDFPSLVTKKYLENENKDVICIVGIESVFAVENLPKILEIQDLTKKLADYRRKYRKIETFYDTGADFTKLDNQITLLKNFHQKKFF